MMKRLNFSMWTAVALAIPWPTITNADAAEDQALLPAKAREKLESAHKLLRENLATNKRGESTWSEANMHAKDEFDALLKAAGSDPELRERKERLLKAEGDHFLNKLAVIAIEMHEHPERFKEIGKEYVNMPASHEELQKYYFRYTHNFAPGVVPAVLRPHPVAPEHQKEEFRLAMEYLLIAPWPGGFQDALPQLIYYGISSIKNPKSVVTLDEMASLYSLPSDRISREIRDACFSPLLMWPSEKTFRVLARHAGASDANRPDKYVLEMLLRGMRSPNHPILAEWQRLAVALKDDQDKEVRAFAAKVMDLKPVPPRPPAPYDPNDPFRQ